MFDTVAKVGTIVAILLFSPLVSSQYTTQSSTQVAPGLTGFPPCDALISAGLGDRVLLATSDGYEPRVQSWWASNTRLRPWCFVQPHSTQEVAVAITALANCGSGAGDWHIAIRSGGHMSIPGANNIAMGATIDLGMMNGSHYDPAQAVASVEPGGTWKDVYYNLLHNGNVTVTGGRDGGVGVGGFLLGGGNSYYTGRNGFGCDTVIGFEVVLANGSIIEANAHENADLWRALKGGGSNFGIVTRFDLQAMPAVDLAYGQSVVSSNYSDEVLDAVVDFTDHLEERGGDDHLITLYTHDTAVSKETTILLIRVNTKGNLNTPGFNKFNEVPTLQSYWEHKSLSDAANESQIPAGQKGAGITLTFLNSPSILRKAASLHTELISTLTSKLGAETFATSLFYQPIPKYLSALGQRSTGVANVLGLDRLPSNAVLWIGGVSLKNDDDAAFAVAQAELSAMAARLREFAVKEGTAADFVYLNYADASQDPLGSYGEENVKFLKEVARQYDPEGFWQERVPGGFKLSRVDAFTI